MAKNLAKLRTVSRHTIDATCVDYHNREIHDRITQKYRVVTSATLP